jgi:glucuronate isomerase
MTQEKDHRNEEPRPTKNGGQEAGIDSVGQGLIGRHLYSLYDEVARQSVPKRFLELLRELKRKTER